MLLFQIKKKYNHEGKIRRKWKIISKLISTEKKKKRRNKLKKEEEVNAKQETINNQQPTLKKVKRVT